MTDHSLEISQLPYERRQFVMVTDTGDLSASHTSWTEEVQRQTAIGAGAGAAVGMTLGLFLGGLGAIPGAAIGGLVGYAKARRSEWKGTGGGHASRMVLPLSSLDAAAMEFPQGHPRQGFVYAAHPLLPGRYLLVADFHLRLFEHKLMELLRLLTSLGAIRYEVRAVEGWSRNIAASLNVDLPMAASGGGVANLTEHGQELVYSARADGNRSRELPAGTVWYQDEATWQELARQRLEHGLDTLQQLTLSYRDDFGVTAEASAGLSALGLKIGGQFERQVDTTWTATATFWTER